MELYLESQKEILKSRGFVLIPGLKYYDLLLHFGASIEDLEKLETGSIHQRLARDLEAAMSFSSGKLLVIDYYWIKKIIPAVFLCLSALSLIQAQA